MTNIVSQKQAARKAAKARRSAAADNDAAQALITHWPETLSPSIIGGYFPIHDELDPRPLLTELSKRGHKLALPVTPPKAAPLSFRLWKPDDSLREGPYGTREPLLGSPLCRPDVLLVPLLAFTQEGQRLGYGGGYYDRTIAAQRAEHNLFACGLAYAAQEIERLPTDQYDQKLDGVLTEDYFRKFT